MPRIHVVVAAIRKDLDAENIAGVIARRVDMELVGGRYMSTSEALAAIGRIPNPERCALILYGPVEETAATSQAALRTRNDLVVLRVTNTGDVRIGATFHRMGLPELDPAFQRCVALLLDNVSQRVGTLSLFTGLLGSAAEVRTELELSANIVRWRLLESGGERFPSADEPLRLDPILIGWLLGSPAALAQDPRTRRVRRFERWTGVSLLDRHRETTEATQLVRDLTDENNPQWLLLEGSEPATWRALVELGAQALALQPIRVEPHRLAGLDSNELRESGVRLGRLARLTGEPMIIDTLASTANSLEDEALRSFLGAIGETGANAAVLSGSASRMARLMGSILNPARTGCRPMDCPIRGCC